MSRRLLLFLLLLVSTGLSAHADSVIYTEFASLSGTLGSTTFTDALTQFTQFSDTSSVTAIGPATYSNTGGFAIISITGVGTAAVLSSNFGALSQSVGGQELIGFADGGTFFTFAEGSGFGGGYDLTTSIGPVVGALFTNGSMPLSTTLGSLTLTSKTGSTFSSFSAAVTPEPPSLVLITTGVLGLALVAKRKFA